jgi:hypothetical protein
MPVTTVQTRHERGEIHHTGSGLDLAEGLRVGS